MEWIKLRTLRSTWITMGALVVLLVGLGAIAAAVSTGSVTTSEDGGGFTDSDPLRTVLTGDFAAVLLVGVLGAPPGDGHDVGALVAPALDERDTH